MKFSLQSLDFSKKTANVFKSLKTVEIVFLVIFVLFIVFPLPIPSYLAVLIENPLGIITMLCITIFLFVYSNPILGVVYILVAYELLRRSSLATGRVVLVNDNNGNVREQKPSYSAGERTTKSVPMTQKTQEVNTVAPPSPATLEEEIVSVSVPVDMSQTPSGVPESNFQPVADHLIAGTSVYN